MPRTTQHDRFGNLLFYAVMILLGYLVYCVFLPFLVPLAWAAVIVVICHPWHKRLERLWGKTKGSAASTFAVICLLILPVMGLAVMFAHEAVQAAGRIQQAYASGNMQWLDRVWQWILANVPSGESSEFPSYLSKMAAAIGDHAATILGVVVRHTAGLVFDFFVMIFAVFFFFRDADTITKRIRALLPFGQDQRDDMLVNTSELIHATVTTSLAVAALQGLVGGTSFAAVGIGTPVFWGVLIAFFSLLPVVGSSIIWIPAAVWLIATGHWGRAIALACLCGALMSIVEHVLRPILLSGRTQLSGLFVFISIVGGIGVFGILGIVVGPLVVATAAGIVETYAEE
jgi:predicted PurR-regulated permease PerM